VLTQYYRLLTKNGGYIWIQTCGTVICSAKNADEQNIIFVNYVISNKEDTNMILDSCQLETVKMEECETGYCDNGTNSPGNDPSNDGHNRDLDNRHLDGRSTGAPDVKDGQGKGLTDSSCSNPNNGSLNLTAKTEDIPFIAAPTPTTTTKGKKRKLKADAEHRESSRPSLKVKNTSNLLDVPEPENYSEPQPESSVSHILIHVFVNIY
jgi:neuronal PAS domain-containing protein 1/3